MPIGEEWVHVPGKSLSAFLIWYHRFQIKLWKCLPLFLCIISFISILSQNVFLLHRNFSHSIDCIRHMCVGVESQWRNPLSLWHFPEKSHRRLLEKSPRCLLSNIRYFTIFKSLDNSTGNQLLVISCKFYSPCTQIYKLKSIVSDSDQMWGVSKEGQLYKRYTKCLKKGSNSALDQLLPKRSSVSLSSDDGWELL